jgi:hypothetical protein
VRFGSRPPARSEHLAWVLLWVGWRGAVSAGILTALLVVASYPPVTVWLPVWVVLTVAIPALDLRMEYPGWLAWLRGRPPKSD